MVPIISRGFWEEDNTDAEHDSPDVTYAHWDSVRSGVGVGFSAVVDAVCGENTNGNEKLVTSAIITLALASNVR
jgi:hypothetical protein